MIKVNYSIPSSINNVNTRFTKNFTLKNYQKSQKIGFKPKKRAHNLIIISLHLKMNIRIFIMLPFLSPLPLYVYKSKA